MRTNLDRSFKLRSFCVHIMKIILFRNLQWSLSNVTNNINRIAKATNTTGVIYNNEIESKNKEIEKLLREIWQIHSILLNRSKKVKVISMAITKIHPIKSTLNFHEKLTVYQAQVKLSKTPIL